MGQLSLTIPTIGESFDNAAADVEAALIAIQTVINGDLDSSNLATNAVGTANIAADAITAAKIAADAVGTSEIAADAVTASEIAANAVGTSEIAADAVTSAKIAADAVGQSEIATGAVASGELATDSVIPTKLALGIQTSAVVGSTVAANTVANIPSLTVTTSSTSLFLSQIAMFGTVTNPFSIQISIGGTPVGIGYSFESTQTSTNNLAIPLWHYGAGGGVATVRVVNPPGNGTLTFNANLLGIPLD
jgi:hypothetical protein